MKINYSPVQTTPFTKYVKIKARFWRFVWIFLYRPTPWFLSKYRIFLLRTFGANVSYKANVSNSSFIEYPWNLTMEKYSSVGERTWVYCLDQIYLKEYACIGQDVKLVTGSHNPNSLNFEMVTGPITIGKGCWLTSNLTVLMNVNIGDYTVVGTKSLVMKSLPENTISYGNPAKVISSRFKL